MQRKAGFPCDYARIADNGGGGFLAAAGTVSGFPGTASSLTLLLAQTDVLVSGALSFDSFIGQA